ncbi:hypothetical protein P43SY_002316 [Pythium insidiosum]|uniref:RNA-binding protein 8A n=1 Tax=Pythium insidiosum TaxID=114742 RepID=A0AAD5M9C8_PYTIN|nr:hypothetical protein P43SY_002316 [Pythium insidiosum]
MGRKPSNVYDYFNRLEPLDGKGLVRYECKKCQKQYASNATRLAEHLKQSGCSPTFQSNQRTAPAAAVGVSAAAAAAAAVNMAAATAATLAVAGPAAAYVPPPNAHVLTGLKKTEHLMTSMLETDLALDTDLLLRLAKLSTCAIADALAQMKIQAHLVDVDLVRGYTDPLSVNICGPALTVKVMPATGPPVKKLPFNYVDTAEMGQVIVISAPEGSTTAVFGGLLATAAKARSLSGVVTDGRVRDVQELAAIGFPAFSRGTSVHGQRGATTVVDVGLPIVVSGCVVRSNDIIRGDINGVVVIPAERANEVATKAELIEEQDNKIADAVQQAALEAVDNLGGRKSMADEVDYESDTAMAMEEEEEEDVKPVIKSERKSGRRVELSSTEASSSSRRAVKGRGTGNATMDSERYPDEKSVFRRLLGDSSAGGERGRAGRRGGEDREEESPVKSVEGWILFISGVHEEAQEEHVLDAFGEDAPVKNVHMNLDRRTGFVKGYALIEFEEYEAAKDAIERMDGQELLGQTIHVGWAFRKGTTSWSRAG